MSRVSTRKTALDDSVEALKREADHAAGKPDDEGAAEAIDELMLGKTRPA